MKQFTIYTRDGYSNIEADNVLIAIGKAIELGYRLKDITKIESNEIKD